MSEATEFIEVYCAPNLAQGGAVREMLSRNGIDCYMNPSVPTLPWDGDVRVLCVATEAARARELIGAYFSALPEGDPDDAEEEEEDEEDDEGEEDDEDDDVDDTEDEKG